MVHEEISESRLGSVSAVTCMGEALPISGQLRRQLLLLVSEKSPDRVSTHTATIGAFLGNGCMAPPPARA
jgi:hypothetical protein